MNRTILITGASRGIGKTIAIELAKEHFSLILWARSSEDLCAVQSECEQYGRQIHIACVDVSDAASIQSVGASSLLGVTQLEGIVINAGIGEWTPFEKTSLSSFRETLDVNLIGAFATLQLALPYLKKSPYSRVVVIGSDSSEFGFKNRAAYCSSKWGLFGLLESLREEVRENKIAITHILSSRVDTYFRNCKPGDRKGALLPDHIAQIVAFIFKAPPTVEIRELKVSSIHSPYGK